MRQYLIGIFVSAILIFLLGYLNVGAQIENFFSAILVAFVLSVLNVMVRPILTIISIPAGNQCGYHSFGRRGSEWFRGARLLGRDDV